jgi:glucosamine--fructose-6-phosphate aminotransferase (isomerizing)
MHDAIYAQPGALRLVTRGNEPALDAAAERLKGAARVVVTGIGSSWHAALVAETWLAEPARLGGRVRAAHGFELAAYGPRPDAETAVIVVSHGGGSRYVKDLVAQAKQAGAATIAVTARGHDVFAGADVTLRTVDAEASSTHTVGYTTALALLGQLASRVGGAELGRAIDGVPDHLATLLGQESWEDLVRKYGDRRRFWFLGAGPNRATAYEAAMKMSEGPYTDAVGYEVEQFLHGMWAAVGASDLVVLLAPPGAAHARLVIAARVAREIGATVLALAAEGDRELGPLAAETIALPDVPETVSPILAVVPLQLFTYHLAVARGVNPDTMRTDEAPYARARAALAP